MNVNKVKFLLSAVKLADFPQDDKPHIVFSGRSNVGKSSVINRLLNRKNFARVGATPGKTQHINFFDVDGQVYFVDLPGYGYASVSKQERQRWAHVIDTYLEFAKERGICVQIVDIRHKPTVDDCAMVSWMIAKGMPFVILANKADKLSARQQSESIKVIKETLGLESSEGILPFSALKGTGAQDLMTLIESFAAYRSDEGAVED